MRVRFGGWNGGLMITNLLVTLLATCLRGLMAYGVKGDGHPANCDISLISQQKGEILKKIT